MRGASRNQPVENGFADVHGARLYYEVAGDGEPLVLVHRDLFDKRMWDDQFREFAQEYRVVRYDLRGSGKSAAGSGDYSHHADLQGLLDFLKIDMPNLVGLALGSSICIDFTLAYPGRTSALVLASSSLGGYRTPSAAVTAYENARVKLPAPEVLDVSLALWVDGPRRRPGVVAHAVRERARQIMAESLALPPVAASQPLDPLAVDRLAEIDAATLVLLGELDVQDSRDVADVLVSQIDGAGLVEMAGAGHLLNMEQPARFNQLVLDFLGG